MTSVISPADVRALIDTPLDDSDLQTVIDREEGWLATVVGPLTGERSFTYYPSSLPDTYHGTLSLRRHVGSLDDVTVNDAGTDLDNGVLRLVRNGWAIRRPTYRWGGPVIITWTPDDQATVETVIIDLLRLRINDSGLASENIGGYGYSTGGGAAVDRRRDRLARSLLEPGRAKTVRVRGADRTDDLYRAN
jgi:hypothetical protein